jgi:hypothetical protein
MKKIPLLLFLLIFTLFMQSNLLIFAQTSSLANSGRSSKSFSVGDTLYVHATSNLILRKSPSKTGEKITSVLFGAAVKVLELPDPANLYVAERIGSFELSGGWVKVKTFEGKMGYLFEGYLMPYAPKLESSEEGFYDAEWFYPSRFDGPRIELPLSPEKGLIEHFKRRYKDGAEFEQQGFEGGVTQLLYLPKGKFSMQQALVLARNLFFSTTDKNGNVTLMNTKAEYDTAKKILTVQSIDGYDHCSIQTQGGQLLITSNSAD